MCSHSSQPHNSNTARHQKQRRGVRGSQTFSSIPSKIVLFTREGATLDFTMSTRCSDRRKVKSTYYRSWIKFGSLHNTRHAPPHPAASGVPGDGFKLLGLVSTMKKASQGHCYRPSNRHHSIFPSVLRAGKTVFDISY